MKRLLSRRGSAMLHVLVVSVIILIVAASLTQMLIQRYTMQARSTESAVNRAVDTGALSRVISGWGGVYCKSFSDSNGTYNCSPNSTTAPGSCSCICTPTNSTQARVVATVDGTGKCALTLWSPPFSTGSCP